MTDPEYPHPSPKLRYPIILVHGLLGFDLISVEFLKRPLVQIEYFRHVPQWLAEAGAGKVWMADLPATGGVEERASRLKGFIQEMTGGAPCHLIAHSMGGLDSRFCITHLGMGDHIVSLTTLGTPHRGSPIAQHIEETISIPLRGFLEKLNFDAPQKLFERLTAAERDLCPDACDKFNRQTPDHPDVAYLSFAGDPPVEAVHPILRLGWERLRQEIGDGANDGLVPVESARWRGWQGTVPADHISLVGWQMHQAAADAFDPAEFYRCLSRQLLEVEIHLK